MLNWAISGISLARTISLLSLLTAWRICCPFAVQSIVIKPLLFDV
jgi:hypothetical protein